MRRIDHVAIAAHDADAAAQYYEGTLGMRRVRDEEVAETGSRLVWLEPVGMPAGGARFQIVQPLRDGPVAEFLSLRGEGLHHVCFAVDDAAAFLAERGEEESALFTGGFGLPCAFLGSAPEGMAVEIVEPAPGAQASPVDPVDPVDPVGAEHPWT
ncbi:methylmalonyl-CoA epimerase [Brachybacterium phenoliresistens]|uniref:Methylmalonyl-CoA epimerase n=1 Tax=Brachybacterium phenoliresistens TaxID=396014 RepID=Z9JX40_9MICO|nr:methylmalonyl-CoA epimerase [Brachybacterium phenoliresistens]